MKCKGVTRLIDIVLSIEEIMLVLKPFKKFMLKHVMDELCTNRCFSLDFAQ